MELKTHVCAGIFVFQLKIQLRMICKVAMLNMHKSKLHIINQYINTNNSACYSSGVVHLNEYIYLHVYQYYIFDSKLGCGCMLH